MNKTPTFDDFWRVYPLKKGKEDAEKKAWNRLTAAEKRKAVAAVPLYIDDCRRSGIDRYKYPQGWLNGKRWQDYEDELTGTVIEATPSPSPLPADGNETVTNCHAFNKILPSSRGAGVQSVTPPNGMEKW